MNNIIYDKAERWSVHVSLHARDSKMCELKPCPSTANSVCGGFVGQQVVGLHYIQQVVGPRHLGMHGRRS